MKKVAFVALLAASGLALGSSLNIPWFADNSPPGTALGAVTGDQTLALVSLNNTTSEDIVCRLDYYSLEGTHLDTAGGEEFNDSANVWTQTNNTFIIPANSTVQARPVKDDIIESMGGLPGGQELPAGNAMPDRPRYGLAGSDPRKQGGSIRYQWQGEPNDIQGMVMVWGASMNASYLAPTGK